MSDIYNQKVKEILVRTYQESDYPDVEVLYKSNGTFGGQFDEARDTKKRLDTLERTKPGSVLVAEEGGVIVGTVTLFEDGRSAWLYRFAVGQENELEVAKLLNERALTIMKERGHTQVLVYAPVGDQQFEHRYASLGFIKGDDYTAYWQDIA